MTIYGIYWTREGIKPGQLIDGNDLEWSTDEQEVRREFETRDDKLWPSALFSAELKNMQLIEEGACPWEISHE